MLILSSTFQINNTMMLLPPTYDTREGNVLTHVCLSVHMGVPTSCPNREYPHPVLMGEGIPHPVPTGGGDSHPVSMGVPHPVMMVEGVTLSSPDSTDWRYTPVQRWGNPPPPCPFLDWIGCGLHRLSRGQYASCGFPQEDFVVFP